MLVQLVDARPGGEAARPSNKFSTQLGTSSRVMLPTLQASNPYSVLSLTFPRLYCSNALPRPAAHAGLKHDPVSARSISWLRTYSIVRCGRGKSRASQVCPNCQQRGLKRGMCRRWPSCNRRWRLWALAQRLRTNSCGFTPMLGHVDSTVKTQGIESHMSNSGKMSLFNSKVSRICWF